MKRVRKDSHGAAYEFDAGTGDLSHRIVAKKSAGGRPKTSAKALLGEGGELGEVEHGLKQGDPALGANGRILCRVCGDNAVRHVHYGGHCCFSCKAFFRRAVNWQNKNDRPFQCKFDRKCQITIKNRKTCQCCRFEVRDMSSSVRPANAKHCKVAACGVTPINVKWCLFNTKRCNPAWCAIAPILSGVM